MLRHVAVFTFQPGTSSEQIRALMDGLAGLPALVPEIRSFAFGPDAGLTPGNDDYVVVAAFEDTDAYMRYAANPDHQALIATLVRPIVASRHAVQFVWE